MRERLVPKGTAPLVRLELKSNLGYVEQEFVNKCLDCFDTRVFLVSTGMDELNPLEQLAIRLLVDSAGVDL